MAVLADVGHQPHRGDLHVSLQAVCGGTSISYQGESIDLGQPFRRATMHELVQESLGQTSPVLHAACCAHSCVPTEL